MSRIYTQQKRPHKVTGVDSAQQSAPAFSNQTMLDILKAPENVRVKPISAEMNDRMSQHFGVSMNGLKVFENENLNQLGETAFAHGNEIHVAKGKFSPETAHGREILMHEAAHVVQQGLGLAHDTSHESIALEAQAQTVQAGGTIGSTAGFSMPVANTAAPVQGFGRRLLKKLKSGWNSLMSRFKKKGTNEINEEPAEVSPVPAAAPAQQSGFDFMSIKSRGMSRRHAEEKDEDTGGFIRKFGKNENRTEQQNQQLDASMRDQYQLWDATLNDDEKDAIYKYKATGSCRSMNRQLRYGGDDEEVSRDIDTLSSAINKSILPHDMVLHRGVSNKVLSHFLNMDPSQLTKENILKSNSIVSDKGFMSTSIDKQKAHGFAEMHSGHMLQINVPAGSHGAYIDPISNMFENEREVLLDKGQKFSIDKIEDYGEIPGAMKIILSLINDDDKGTLR